MTVENPDANEMNSMPKHRGEYYTTTLARLHKLLRPKTYFEIGTLNGSTLELASCRCVSVDPEFKINSNVIGDKEELHVYQLTSDDFFSLHDPVQILGQKIDLAFLDGMHLFEFLLRDFINTERSCKPNSVIVLHDCIPIDVFMTRREQYAPEIQKLSQEPAWWCGDVWKTVVALKKYRKDLKIIALDSAPTGLVLVTGLNPGSTALQDGYFGIVEDLSKADLLEGRLRQYHDEIKIKSCSALQTTEHLAPGMWL